jgi:PadR family transcriptional regulator, regulatory protein AphA
MKARLTSTSYALLGLLALRPWTTYELAKQVQRALGWFWPRAERRLYDEPKRLEAAGLATSTREMTGARPRTVYSVTDEGSRALHRWLGEPPAPPVVEFEGLVKVFFADGGTLEQLRTTLASIAETAEERTAELEAKVHEQARAEVMFPERAHLNTLVLRYHLDQEQAITSWARWALHQTEGWRSSNDPGSWDHRAVLAELAGVRDRRRATP